jgi:glycerol-3-phosphate acyltransferase PlsY
MNWVIALSAAAVGYLLGSISFARIIMKRVAPDTELTGIDIEIPDADEAVHLEAVAGTAVSMKLGGKWGGLTGILDILKVLVPTVVFRFVFRDAPYYLLVAAMGMVGHNWPIYYRFKGGRGISPMTGGFLAVAPIGTIVTSIVGMFVGLALKMILLSFMLGPLLMIPWLSWRTRSIAHIGYAVFVNLLFAVAMIPDIQGILDRKRRGIAGDFTQAMELTPMSRGIKKMGVRLGMIKDDE